MTETWASTYCFVFGLFAFVKRHILEIYLALTCFTLGMIAWWYIATVIS